MLRIRKDNEGILITATMERRVGDLMETERESVENDAEIIKDNISDGFDTLLAVYEKFDEVRIGKDGALHCRNKPPVKKKLKTEATQ